MPTYPNIPFSPGDDWSAELGTLAFNQVFDDQTQYLGHRPRILDTDLSNAAGQIKQRVATIEDAFKVSVESGRSLRYQSGVTRLPDGSQLAIASGLVTAPDNTTSFVYINPDGSVVCAAKPTVMRVLLAKVTTVSGAVSALEDLRHIATRVITPQASSIKTFGGSNATDKTCTANEVFDAGYYYFRDFTVPSGISITVDKFAKFYCSGNVSIQGTINVSPAGAGASPYATNCATGVNLGGLTGGGAGAGSGSAGGNSGSSYPYAAQPFGSGGGLGFMIGTPSDGGSLGAGGKGGGGVWFEASGSISVTGGIFANGTAGSAGTISLGAPTISGSGGGSGGLVLLSSLVSVTVAASATIGVVGGIGGSGLGNGAGGSGGGGGFVVLQSPSNNTTGSTIQLGGGARGTNAGTGGTGGGGGGGFGGAGGNQSAGGTGRLIVSNFIPVG